MSDSNFDSMLGKLRKFKDELKKYDESRQSGVNQEPPMTQKEKTKKAEFLAMSKHGQWSLGKTERIGQDNSKAKTGKGKPMALTPEKESPHNDPKGEPYAGSGKDRMNKMDEPHKDDPHHEAKEKKIAKDIKAKAQKLDDMHKGDKNKTGISAVDDREKVMGKMDDATTLQGPISSTVAMKMDEGSAPGGDSSISSIEKGCSGKAGCSCADCMKKNDLPKDAEYQKHSKEPKERA